MADFINNFHFLRPWLLLGLFIPVWLYFAVRNNYDTLSSWGKVCDKKLLKFLIVKGNGNRHKAYMVFMFSGLVAAILAVAGPSWKKQEYPALNYNTPLMAVLDLSSEMKQTDITPSRLTRAKMAVKELLSLSHNFDSGLIVYTDEPFLISPLSSDSRLVVNLLPAVDFDIMPINGERLDRAINLAVEKIKSANYNHGNIVVFASGAGTGADKALTAAKNANKNGVYVSTIVTAEENNLLLKQIAQAGGGVSTDVTGLNAQEFLDKILNKQQQQLQETKNKIGQWQDYGYYLSIIPLICCLYFFRRGLLVLILLCVMSNSASAGFWFSDNYEAMKDFKQSNYQQAAKKFTDGNWRGASLYKAGDYQKAASIYAEQSDAESLYNLGNALAKSGQINEAVKTYEQVLQKNAKHEDAEFNLNYLKQLQQNEQQNNQNQQQEQKERQKNSSEQNQNNNDMQQNEQQKQSADSQDENQRGERQQNNSSDEKLNDEQQNTEENSSTPQEQNNNVKTEEASEKRQIPEVPAKEGDKNDKYDEQVQSREQRFRDVQEDKGGLLRAFIYKEYNKNRYGE